MAYIGKQPVVGNFVKLDAITTSATATYNLLNGGVAYFPQTANNCIVSLNGVIQSPTSAYTISGSTIVFSDALTSSDTIDFILVLGDVLSIGTPSDGTVSLTKLTATGTKDATTFLRGDNTFATVSTDGTADWDTSVKTTGFTATANKGYFCNTTSAGFTVTLPATPSAGDEVILVDYAGTWDTNNLTINPNSSKIFAQTSNVIASKDRESFRLVYIDNTQGWIPYSGYQEGTTGISIPYSVDFLVVAGGAGGGGNYASDTHGGGGGGAGGYRNSYSTESSGGGGSSEASLPFATGTVYTITVGGGGSGNANGSDSSISGSNITTITSTGGGKGGSDTAAASGGSGGGGDSGQVSTTGGSGTANQGYAGGTGYLSFPDYSGAGGGGASAVGVTPTGGFVGGNGGAGLASSITGSSVTRAGGGGGACRNALGNPSTGGTGGSSIGGNGGSETGSRNGTAGSTNTGSGGGGEHSFTGSPGAGGSGVVILRMPTASYSGTTTGSPSVSTSGADTILVYNASGTYTG